MAKKRVVKKQRGKKKKWFEIALPSLLRGGVFAQGYAETPENLIGRTLNASLGDVLKTGSKRHMSVKLIVNSVKTSTAHTIIKSIDVSGPYLLRKTRKNSKISAKFVGPTSDGVNVDVRLCAIAHGHCLTTAKKEIRKVLGGFIEKRTKSTKKDALILDLINNNLQMKVKKQLHKIHPMRSVELEKIVIK
jgi:small subunit ribosomal protein S3Ae